MLNWEIREAVAGDIPEIRRVYASAFSAEERALVSRVAERLLVEVGPEGGVSLVATARNEVLGHIGFSPVEILDQPARSASILAPLAIALDHQRLGVGTALVRHGLERLASAGVALVFVYGDPAYYGRFGFLAEQAAAYRSPYPLQYPFGWQALALSPLADGPSPCGVVCVEALSDPALW